MKLSFRSKLTLSFILVIILPLVLFFLIRSSIASYIENNPEVEDVLSGDYFIRQVLESVEENFYIVEDYSVFDQQVRPFLSQYSANLYIVDTEGVLLYDSKGEKQIGNVIDSRDLMAVRSESQEAKKLNQVNFPVIKDNNTLATAVLTYDMGAITRQDLYKKTIYYLLGSFATGLVLLIVLVIFFAWLLSRTILLPLNELMLATEKIASGDLDYKINYEKNDEIGRLCSSFDTMREKLKESLGRQSASEKARKELVASISHDLRTPLASIKGYVEGLQDGIARDPQMVKHYLSIIKNKTEKLDHLIEDLFQYSQLELGKLPINLVERDFEDMLEGILAPIERDFENEAISFIVHRPLPSKKIIVDEHRIAQVVENIVQNAVRFIDKKEGLIQVKTRLIKDESFLLIEISDNGFGISPEDQERIFDRFYRGEKSRSRDFGGAGLGLSIAKYIVEAHNGSIWLDSSSSQGTIFCFVLPVAKEAL